MADALRGANYQCDCASNADDALSMIAATNYDVFLLDAEMAGNSWLELVRKTNETASGLPVILVTDHPTMETAIDAVHLPVEAYLVKPIDFNVLQPFLRRSAVRCRLYRTVTDVKERIARWNTVADKLQELLREPLDANLVNLAGPLLTATFDNILKSVVDLRRLFSTLSLSDYMVQRAGTSELLGKMDLTRTALRETIMALEESKHAFKSKRLGELRRQLQAVLGVLDQE